MNVMEIVTEQNNQTAKTTEVVVSETKENEVPSYILILREIFVGMIGVHGIYIFVNFIFKNYPGSLLSLLLTISAIYTHFDRRVATYSLNIGVQLLLGITIGLSVYSPVQGFEKYFNDPDLNKITLLQLVYCGILIIISIVLARFEQKHRKNILLKNSKEV